MEFFLFTNVLKKLYRLDLTRFTKKVTSNRLCTLIIKVVQLRQNWRVQSINVQKIVPKFFAKMLHKIKKWWKKLFNFSWSAHGLHKLISKKDRQMKNGLGFWVEIGKIFIKVHILWESYKILTVCTVVKSYVKISQNFVAFSEYMNFKKHVVNKYCYFYTVSIYYLYDDS